MSKIPDLKDLNFLHPWLKGGTPQKKLKFFFTKSCQITISLKSEKNNHVLYAKYGIIFISARGGGPFRPPPGGDRVKVTYLFLFFSKQTLEIQILLYLRPSFHSNKSSWEAIFSFFVHHFQVSKQSMTIKGTGHHVIKFFDIC